MIVTTIATKLTTLECFNVSCISLCIYAVCAARQQRTGDRVLTWAGLVPDDKRSGAAIRAAIAERAEERRLAHGGLPAIPVADDDAELKEYVCVACDVCVESFKFMLARWGLYVGGGTGGTSLHFRSLIHADTSNSQVPCSEDQGAHRDPRRGFRRGGTSVHLTDHRDHPFR